MDVIKIVYACEKIIFVMFNVLYYIISNRVFLCVIRCAYVSVIKLKKYIL